MTTHFIVGRTLDLSRPYGWSKILLLLKNMGNTAHEWIFWTDVDSMVMNQAIPLEDFVDDDYDIVIARDFNAINTGQFLIRNCEWSRKFLANVYTHTECINLSFEFEEIGSLRDKQKKQ